VLRGGGVTHVRDLAGKLLHRGHSPIVYSNNLGAVAENLRLATIPVVEDLNQLAITPDLIHGHNHLKTMTALLHFPEVPAVYTCHSWMLWQDAPPIHPRLLRYVAVDHTCYDRLILEHAVPEEKIRILPNAVDLARFKPRKPLPVHPERALVFSNNASEETYLGVVREACSRAGITLDVIGAGAGMAVAEPEQLLGQYDLVFAKARCALESLAVGVSVILCDMVGAGPMVTTQALPQLRRFNFGIRTLQRPLTAESLLREIKRYNHTDAEAVSVQIRQTAGLDNLVEDTMQLYQEVVAAHDGTNGSNLLAESRAAAAYLARLDREMLAHSAASMRMRERIRHIPLIGKLGMRLSSVLAGRARW